MKKSIKWCIGALAFLTLNACSSEDGLTPPPPQPDNEVIIDNTELNSHLPLLSDNAAIEKYKSENPLPDGGCNIELKISAVSNPSDAHFLFTNHDMFIIPREGGNYQMDMDMWNTQITAINFYEDFDAKKEFDKLGLDESYFDKSMILGIAGSLGNDSYQNKHDYATESPNASVLGKVIESSAIAEETFNFSDIEGYPTQYTFQINRHIFSFPENNTGKDRLIYLYYSAVGSYWANPEYISWEEYMTPREWMITFLQKG